MKLKSDRELDKWIAENVFNNKYTPCIGEYGSEPYEDLYPNYTSDLNEAIKVFEWVIYNYTIGAYTYNLSMGTYKAHKGKWYIAREDYTDGLFIEEDFIPSQESPAMAICLAAYKLKTGKDWGEE